MRKLFVSLVVFLSILSGSFAQQLADGIAAVIGNEIILQSEIQQYMQSYIMQNRIQVKPDSPLLKKLRQETLDKLIEQKLMLAKAEDDTLQVDEQMLDMQLKQRMQYMLEQAGSEDKLEQAFGSPMKKIKKDMRKVIKEQLLVEQARSKKLRELKVSRREVEQFYKSYKDSLPALQETVDISHILMQIKASEQARQIGYEKAEIVMAKLKSGEAFEKLAGEYSSDPASAKRGGDLGTISRGDFVPEFETAAYNLKDDEISDIVETQFGYHIIQMIERKGEKIHTRHILIQVTPTEEDEQEIIKKLSEIKTEIMNGGDFGEIALKYSDDNNAAKDKGHLGVFEVDRLAIPAFQSILKDMQIGGFSAPFKTEYGYHIVRLNDRKQARSLQLAADWQKIHEFALNFKMDKVYKEWISDLKKSVAIEIRNSN